METKVEQNDDGDNLLIASRKRKAEEITDEQILKSDSFSETNRTPLSSSSSKDLQSNTSNSDKNQSFPSTSTANSTAMATGFSAYAKTNPFLAAASAATGKTGFGFGSSSSSSTVFGGFGGGFSSQNNASVTPSDASKHPSGLSISISDQLSSVIPSHTSSIGRENFNMPPPLVVPSPKSPKPNPFSSPSPVHNPFMTIVESKDELWKTMAKDKLSDEEAAKSLLFGTGASVTKKSRLANYNGSFGNSYFGDCSYAYSEEDKENEDNTPDKGDDIPNEEEDDVDEDDEENAEADETKDGISRNLSPGKMYTTYALPENVVVVTGEEDDDCLLQIRVKLYRLGVKSSNREYAKSSDTQKNESSDKDGDVIKSDPKLDINSAEWVEVGVGPLKVLRQKGEEEIDLQPDDKDCIKDHQSNGKNRIARLVIRREDKKGGIGTKLLMNTRLNQFVSVAKQSDKMIRLICVNGADPLLQLNGQNLNQLQTYLIRTKTVKEFDDLLEILNDLIESSKNLR